MISGLDRLCEAVEATEAAARRQEGFMCPHPGCARVFSKRYNQQAHMRLHDGTRPFSCPRCKKDFMWKSSLKSHAKMHDKMDAAAAALVAKRAAGNPPNPHDVHHQNQPNLPNKRSANQAVRTSRKNAKPVNNGVAKRSSNSASPSRKVPRHTTSKRPTAESKAKPSSSSHRSAQSHHMSSPHARPSNTPKAPVGRQSPDSVTRMDLETATLLTMFR